MYKQDNKDIRAVLISVILHILLFVLLILGSFYNRLEIMGGGEGDGEIIGAIMVDTGRAAQEWGRIQQQKKGQTAQVKPNEINDDERIKQQEIEKQKLEQQQREEQARQQALIREKQIEEAKAKEARESAKLKAEAEAKRLAALAKQAEEEAKAKAEQVAKAKAEKELKEKEAREKVQKEAKAKAEKEAKEKAEKEAKAKAEKAKAEAAKRRAEQAALDSFLNGGDIGGGSAISGGNSTKQGSQGLGASNGAGDGGKTGDQYAGVIKREIQRRFLKEPSFANKVCVVEVAFLRDGSISSYTRISGPDDICGAALSAVARTKKVPAAPTDDIYEKYKKSPIEFKLR